MQHRLLAEAARLLRRQVCALAGLTFATCAFVPNSVRAADLASVYRDAKASVVYIVCVKNDGVTSGSGFIYTSGNATSAIITANHVVEGASTIDVILDSDPQHRYQATVLKRDHVRDVAELSIPIGHRVGLQLEKAPDTREGMNIAAIGYPRAAKKFERSLGDDLQPSIHSGIVSAVRFGGEVLQYDATTDYGDSGGPVIDANSGRVVGVVRGSLLDASYLSAGLETLPGSNVAMSAYSIAAVLADIPPSIAKIAKASAGITSTIATMPLTSAIASRRQRTTLANDAVSPVKTTVPSAHVNPPAGSSSAEYRVGVTSAHRDDPNADSADGPLVTQLVEHYKTTDEVYAVLAAPGIAEASASALAGYCDDNRLNAIVEPSLRRRTSQSKMTGRVSGRNVDVSLALEVMDCSGEPFFSGNTAARAVPLATTSHSSEVRRVFGGMLAELIGDFDRFRRAHAGAWTSLLKTGIALDSADDRFQSLIGFELDKGSQEYRVTTVYTGGPGAVAGIEVGDRILAVDGKPVKGLSRDALVPLLNASKYMLSVLRPGGPTVLQVEPKKAAELLAALKR